MTIDIARIIAMNGDTMSIILFSLYSLDFALRQFSGDVQSSKILSWKSVGYLIVGIMPCILDRLESFLKGDVQVVHLLAVIIFVGMAYGFLISVLANYKIAFPQSYVPFENFLQSEIHVKLEKISQNQPSVLSDSKPKITESEGKNE